ncbi:Xyloglucanase Xgh74A precursor [compost metagenome]
MPAVYVYGRVSGVEGIFRSDDKGTTWIRINDDANRIGNDPNCMEGDRQVYGRVYIGTNGRGYYYGEPYHQ